LYVLIIEEDHNIDEVETKCQFTYSGSRLVTTHGT